MLKKDKIRINGLLGYFLKDLKRPLEELVAYNGVEAINSGISFHIRKGLSKGMNIAVYNPNTKRLKINCQAKRGGQEIYVVVTKPNLESVKSYIRELNKKYFKWINSVR